MICNKTIFHSNYSYILLKIFDIVINFIILFIKNVKIDIPWKSPKKILKWLYFFHFDL